MYNEKGVYPDTVPLKRNDRAPTAGNYSYFFIKPKTDAWQEVSELEKEAGKHGAVLAVPTKKGVLITIANSDDEHFKEIYKDLKTEDITKNVMDFQRHNFNASIEYVLNNLNIDETRNLDFEWNINHLDYNEEEVRKNKLENERIIRETLKEQEKEEKVTEKVIINNLNNEQKKMSYESSTENILQLGNTIGLLKDNFSGNKSQEAINQLEKLKSNEELTAEDFLSEIQNIMHISEEKSHTVRHYIDTEQYNLRISNHSANAIHAKYRPNETSIVIKLSSTHFHGDKNSYLAEYVYNSKNLSKEKQNGILNGLQDWLQTGYFTDKTYDKEFYSPNKELYLEQINTNQTKLLKANIKELNLKNKEIDIWVDKAEKDNKRITELSNQDKEQKEIIKKQNQLLYGQCSIKVNGQDREIKKGLVNAFPNAVIKLDEANQKIQDLSQNKSINKKLNNSNGIEM